MSTELLGAGAFFAIVGASFAFAPGQVAGRALANANPGPEGLRGIRRGGYLLLGLAALLTLFSLYQFVTE